jgi:MFS family permease
MPKDLALRISYFYCASALSGAFSGLLAAAIAKMDGIGGLEGWRWIFILEGLLSVVLGVMCFFLLIDTPAFSTRWLSAEEIRFLELSMFIKQGGTSSEESSFKMRDLKKVLQNWRIYVQAYFLLCQSALSYGEAIPSIYLPTWDEANQDTCHQEPNSPFQPSPKQWASVPPTPN